MKLRASLASLCLAALAGTASADLIIGGSRSAGMGGAGLALLDDPAGRGYRNPAIYAMKPQLFRVYWPRFGYQVDGIGLGDYGRFFDLSAENPLNADDLGQLARTFGDGRVTVGGTADLGVQVGNFAIDLSGQLVASTIPNDPLKDWVNAGSDLNNIPADAQLDGYGLGTGELGVTSALRLPTGGEGDLAVGARVKLTKAYYSHHLANASDISSGNSSEGAEMNGRSFLEDEGLGLDAGAYFRPGNSGLSFALVVNNLIQPTSGFSAISPDNGGIVRVQPFPTTIDAGVAMQKGIFLIAADVIDITDAAGRQEIRLGAELGSSRVVALRAGYATNSGFTVGAGFGGFNVAFGERIPVAASFAIRF